MSSSFVGAANSRASEDAVWWQARRAEATAGRGQAAAAVLIDLWKAYELVDLTIIQHRGVLAKHLSGLLMMAL